MPMTVAEDDHGGVGGRLPKMLVNLGHTNRLLTVGKCGGQELLSKVRDKDGGMIDESLLLDP